MWYENFKNVLEIILSGLLRSMENLKVNFTIMELLSTAYAGDKF